MTESGTNETPEKTKLFVGGLQSANGGCLATEEQLTTYFKKWGNVVNFQLIKDQNQKSKGYGFVTFETGVEADECLKYNGHAYDNKQITVKPCNDKQNRRPYHSRHGMVQSPGGGGGYNQGGGGGYGGGHHHHRPHGNHNFNQMIHMRNNHHGGPRGVYGGGYGGPHDPRLNYGAHHNQYPINLSENESIKSNSSNKKKSDDELQVFVGGLPPTANEDDLAKHFAKFGLVDHVSVAKDKNGGDGHKGFAFITFQDKQSREKSLHQPEHRINNRQVKVEAKRPSQNRRDPNLNRNQNRSGNYNQSPRSQKSYSQGGDRNGRQSVENRIENGISPDPRNYQQGPMAPQMITPHGQYQMVQHQNLNNYHPMYPQQSQQQMIYNQHQFNHYQLPNQIHQHQFHQFINQQGQDGNIYPSYMVQPHHFIQPMMMAPHPHVSPNQPPMSQSPQSGQSGGYYMNHPGAPPGGVMAIPQVQHHGGNIQQTTPPQQQAGTPTSPNNSHGRSPSTH